jgi:O-antigen/teichoic acid export membrane protein
MNAERISLTYFASVASLAYYSVAYTYASLSVLVALSSVQVLVPMFSRLQSSADREHLQQLYCRSVGFLCLALAPAAVLLAVAAKPVLSIWAGYDYGQHSTAACYVLLVGLVFNGLANIPASLLVATNRVGLLARYRYFELPPYLVAVVVFTSRFGIVGAATAWSVRAIVDAAVVYIAAERVEHFQYLRDAPRIRSGVLALLLPPIIVLMIGPPQWFWTPIATLISLSLYLFVIWRSILTNSERAWIVASSRRGLGKLSLARVMN